MLIYYYHYFGSIASSYLCFLWFEWCFIVISRKYLWSSSSYIYYYRQFPIIMCYCFYTISFICFSAYINDIYILCSFFLLFFFISWFSLNTLFTETNLSWLLYESIKTLEFRISIVFYLFFLAALFYHISFFLLDNWLIVFNS